MLELAGIDGGRDRLQQAIDDGSALQKFIDVTRAHGGDTTVIEDPSKLAVAPEEEHIAAPTDGYVTRCDAMTIGAVATRLGAGREKVDDEVEAKFTNVDRKSRTIALSIKAKEIHEEAEAVQGYRAGETSSGTSLGDLLKEQIGGQDAS